MTQASPLLDICAKELKTVSREICIPTFTATLFTEAKRWKQPNVQRMNG